MKALKSARFALILVLAIVILCGFGAIASADDPAFLCPVVGDGNDPGVGGIYNADDANGDHGMTTIPFPDPPVGPSFLPGNNQAGANADPCHAFNREGPGTSDPPGQTDDGTGNSDWSPIWPGDYPFEECD